MVLVKSTIEVDLNYLQTVEQEVIAINLINLKVDWKEEKIF